MSGDPLSDALGDRLEHDRPIGELTTYRVGGPARTFATVEDPDELRLLAEVRGDRDVLVVGRGSNLLVRDAGFDGIVVQLGEAFATIDPLDGSRLRAGGAASLPVVARRSVALGLTGFEWAVGVPGSIGGAVRMNAGGHGADTASVLERVRLVDLRTGEDVEVPVDELHLGYRRSSVEDHQVVLHADLRLAPGDREAGEAQLSEIVRWRREHQPGGQNAGSVFTNPPDDSAGRLIDAAGGRGLRVGTAEVSTKHANFIQADAGGSADDVFALMVEVAALVRRHAGVALHPETRLVGFPDFDGAVAAAVAR